MMAHSSPSFLLFSLLLPTSATLILLLTVTLLSVRALDNGLALTPQMGFNTWNHFRCAINETVVRELASAMASSGLSKAGYQYVNLDDCWAANSRDAHNVTQANATKFPSGIPALASYIHSLNLKFGLYSDAGLRVCSGGSPGSYGYEEVDARTWAAWGVDYLKYDDCYANGLPYIPRYSAMRDALQKAGRPTLYSLCSARFNRWQPMWSRDIGNSGRTTPDIGITWASVLLNLDGNNQWWQWAGRGYWNDPDMLRVGQQFLTDDEEVSHFSLWCLIKAPLILGHDMIHQTPRTVEILTNVEVIALNQDSLGHQGRLVFNDSVGAQVWAAPMQNGDVAAVLLNRAGTQQTVTARWADLSIIPNAARMWVKDLWLHRDMGLFNASYTVMLRPHASVTIRLRSADPVSVNGLAVGEKWGALE